MPQGTMIMQMARAEHAAKMKVAAGPPVFVQISQVAMAAAVLNQPAEQTVAKPLIDPVSMQVNIAEIKTFNPALSMTFSQMAPAVVGVLRSALTCPVSLSENVADTQWFEAPQDSAKKYYLPRYKLRENETTSGKQFDVKMRKSDTGGTIEVGLKKYSDLNVSGAEEINHSVSVIISFDAIMDGGGRMEKQLSFTEYTPLSDGIRAVLPVDGLTQLTQLYKALTDDSFKSKLIIRRLFTIAVPLPPPPVVDDEVERPNKGDQWQHPRRVEPIWKNPQQMRTVPMFKSQQILVTQGVPFRPPTRAQLYRETSRSLDWGVSFVFPASLHGYIFEDIENTGSSDTSLIKRQVGEHRYYQDMARSGVFYYLPDAFKMTRRPAPEFSPFMRVSMNGDGSLDETAVTFEYAAVPYTNEVRLRAAGAEFNSFVKAGETIQFMPLIALSELAVALPGGGGTGPFVPRPQALVELREGIHDSITTSLAEFQVLYDALLGGSQTILTGQVTVSVSVDDKILIPFSGRLDDLAGTVCSIQAQYDPAAGKGTVIVKNEIESQVTVKAIKIMLRDEIGLVSFNSQGFDVNTLLTLAPKQEISMSILPLDPLAVNKPLELHAELDGVQVHPDREAIWNAILNPNAPIGYERTISVETFDETFVAQPGAANDAVVKAVIVNFSNGNTVVLRPNVLTAEAVVYVSLSSYILGKTDTREYKYQLEVVTLAGKRKVGAGEWKTDQSDTLFITPDLIQ